MTTPEQKKIIFDRGIPFTPPTHENKQFLRLQNAISGVMEIPLIFDFVRRDQTAMLATVSPETKPEAAIISFAITDDFEVIFQTFVSYRKYRNLKGNASVAIVFGWDKKITVQYEGLAHELSGNELTQCKEKYFEQNPNNVQWDEVPGAAWFKVSPKWIRYLDNTEPKTTHEITFL